MRQKGFILLPILTLIVLTGIIGFLIYNNTQIKKADVKINPTAVPATYPISPSPASNSQPEPTAKIVNGECYENSKYFVIVNPENGDLLVKYKPTDNFKYECKYGLNASDFEIKNERADYYLGLENNFLIIDSGTAPPPRGLKIYDVDKRLKVYDGLYSPPTTIKNNSIEFWKETPSKVTKENCPEKDGWGGLDGAIEELVRLEFSGMRIISLNEYRCRPRQ